MPSCTRRIEQDHFKLVHLIFFFFSSRRRHTRLQGDWSSDVCSSDLGQKADEEPDEQPGPPQERERQAEDGRQLHIAHPHPPRRDDREDEEGAEGKDRKSTRLNSSHLVISYAVFCLKKKKK